MNKYNVLYGFTIIDKYYTFFTENRDTFVSESNVIAPIIGLVDT